MDKMRRSSGQSWANRPFGRAFCRASETPVSPSDSPTKKAFRVLRKYWMKPNRSGTLQPFIRARDDATGIVVKETGNQQARLLEAFSRNVKRVGSPLRRPTADPAVSNRFRSIDLQRKARMSGGLRSITISPSWMCYRSPVEGVLLTVSPRRRAFLGEAGLLREAGKGDEFA